VPTWSDPRRYNGHWGPLPGLRGQHVCHSDWFATGEPWPVTLPPTVYDDEWIPECCDREAEGAQGGVELGGAAGDLHTQFDPTAGGVELGGASGHSGHYTDPTAGGVQLGGAAGESTEYTDPTAGGVQLGGAAGESTEYTDPTAGGVQLGGAAGDVIDAIDATEGGVELGGATGESSHNVDPTAGGVQLGGAAGESRDYTDPTAGGVQLGGAAGDVIDAIDATEGGVELGGEAGDVFTPGVTPGNSCTTAGLMAVPSTYNGSIDTAGGPQWLYFVPTSGTQYTITITSATATTTLIRVTEGLCSGPSPVGSALNDNSVVFTASVNTRVNISVSWFAGADPHAYSLSVTSP